MPRAENEQARHNIEQAAIELFGEVGYTQATYAAIAKRCAMSRALVQYYFKKKEDLALAFFTHLLDACVDTLAHCTDATADANDVEGQCAHLHRIGQLFFAYLMDENRYRQFLLDILSSRELTESVLVFNATWALERLAGKPTELTEITMTSVIVEMGGFYELLYYCLKRNKPIDVATHLKNVVEAFAQASSDTQIRLDTSRLSDKELGSATKKVAASLYAYGK